MATDGSFAPFDLVQQFDQMRQRLGGAGGSMPQHEMPAAPQVAPVAAPSAAPAVPSTPAAPQAAGVGVSFSRLQSQFPGLRMTSGYRDPKHNAEVGGVPNSWHTQKDSEGHPRAMDFVGSVRDMQSAAAWAKMNGAKEVLVHNVGSGQHLHVAF